MHGSAASVALNLQKHQVDQQAYIRLLTRCDNKLYGALIDSKLHHDVLTAMRFNIEQQWKNRNDERIRPDDMTRFPNFHSQIHGHIYTADQRYIWELKWMPVPRTFEFADFAEQQK